MMSKKREDSRLTSAFPDTVWERARRSISASFCGALCCLIYFTPVLRAEPVILEYWEKWTGIEAAAMERAVDAFNASQDRIHVKYSAVSQIDLKLMLAIAGRRPPDIAGLWSYSIPVYVENNALHPVDKLAASSGIQGDQYLPSIWRLCRYRERLWALPSTPASLALHWNKRLFREAGLDPDTPPGSIRELEDFNARLTRTDSAGCFSTIGHLPEEPGWWRSMWGYWFGTELCHGQSITACSPGNLRALQWMQNYPRTLGQHNASAFLEGFGNFASPLNPFIQEKVAMELQGPWMWNFICKYGKGQFELGVGPFPSEAGRSAPPVTIVESDVLVIPAGCRHVREAFEFLSYINRREVIESICAAQFKFSPLVQVTPGFWEKHPHPYIHVFYDLAASPGAKSAPQIPNWMQYKAELDQATKEVWAMRLAPSEALGPVQERMQRDLNRRIERWDRLRMPLEQEWSALENRP